MGHTLYIDSCQCENLSLLYMSKMDSTKQTEIASFQINTLQNVCISVGGYETTFWLNQSCPIVRVKCFNPSTPSAKTEKHNQEVRQNKRKPEIINKL